MRTETLEYFLEIVSSKSFVQAANNLFITQQGLSKAIASLEKELGVTLFNRNGKQVEPTDEGLLVASFAQEVLQKQAELKTAIVTKTLIEHAHSFDNIVLYSTPFICNSFFNLLETEMDAFGLNDIVVQELSLSKILMKFDSVNDGFALVNVAKEDLTDTDLLQKCTFIPLFSMDIMLYAPNTMVSPHADGIIAPSEIADIPLAFYNEPILNRFAENTLGSSILQRATIVQHSSNHERIISLLASGKAATFSDTFSFSIKKPSENMVALRISPAQPIFVGFFVSSELGEDSPQYNYIRRLKAMLEIGHGTYMSRNTFSLDAF